MALHLVFTTTGFAACQQRTLPDDHIVLLGDGVYHAATTAGNKQQPLHIHVLGEDLQARGLAATDAALINYDDLVALCCNHTPIVCWND